MITIKNLRLKFTFIILCIAMIGCSQSQDQSQPTTGQVDQLSAKSENIKTPINKIVDSEDEDITTLKKLSELGVNIVEIYDFPNELLPNGYSKAFFGFDRANIPSFSLFYGKEKCDTLVIASNIEEDKAFIPVSCFGGPSVSYKDGHLTFSCEENANLYSLSFGLKGNELHFEGGDIEDPNEEILMDMENAISENDPVKYCRNSLGVQYKGQQYLDDCITMGLDMAVKKAITLIKEGKQEEANLLIKTMDEEFCTYIPNDTLWNVLRAMKK